MGERITNRNVESLVKKARAALALSRKREVIIWDEEIKGLGLRVGQSKSTWLLKKRLGKGGSEAKVIWTTLGDLSLLGPQEARGKARSTIEDIRNGNNPNDKTRATRQADIAAYRDGKLADLWGTWLSISRARGKSKRLKGTDYWHGVERLGRVEIIPVLGPNTPVRNITKSQIRRLIENKEVRSPSVARMMFAALRPFLLWCVEREAITVSPMAELSQPRKVKSRDRVLNDQELVAVWCAACSLPYPWGPFYRLCLLTAQRRDEVATMEWRDVDLKKREWKIPSSKTKNGREHLVHLSGWAIDILYSLKQKAGDKFVFTTSKRTNAEGELEEIAISGFSKARIALDKKLESLKGGSDVQRWTIHDLRRTAATGMAALKVPPHIVERVLNHTSGKDVGGLVGIYQHFEYVEERRQALIDWAGYINELILSDMRREREQSDILSFNSQE